MALIEARASIRIIAIHEEGGGRLLEAIGFEICKKSFWSVIFHSNSRHIASGKRSSDSKAVRSVTGHFGPYRIELISSAVFTWSVIQRKLIRLLPRWLKRQHYILQFIATQLSYFVSYQNWHRSGIWPLCRSIEMPPALFMYLKCSKGHSKCLSIVLTDAFICFLFYSSRKKAHLFMWMAWDRKANGLRSFRCKVNHFGLVNIMKIYFKCLNLLG